MARPSTSDRPSPSTAAAKASIERTYLITLGRRPENAERARARGFLSVPGSSMADFCLALMNLTEFVYVD